MSSSISILLMVELSKQMWRAPPQVKSLSQQHAVYSRKAGVHMWHWGPWGTLQQALPGQALEEGVREDALRAAARRAAQARGRLPRQQPPD